MSTTPQDLLAEIREALAEIEAIIERQSPPEGGGPEELTLRERLTALRGTVVALETDLRLRAQGVDRFVRGHAWQMTAAAAATAFLAGLLCGRRRGPRSGEAC